MNFNDRTAVDIDAIPSRSSVTIADTFSIFEVKGAAIEASLSEILKPASAALRAAQSFAPSPHA